MPVVSPQRTNSSPLSGSYRPTFSSSSINRPYYSSSSSYVPRINTTYSERFTSRSYIDSDGRRIISRQGSITEDGITTRFKEESREGSTTRRDSISRDSGISSVRENSIFDLPRRDSSLSRASESRHLSAINVAESVAEMRNKYSPSNYVPSCLRNNDNISRSKSINDIGKPPVERSSDKSTIKYKVNESLNLGNNGLRVMTNLSNNTNSLEKMYDNVLNEDDNGNKATASVAEIRKKFDQGSYKTNGKCNGESLAIEGTGIKISENAFKKRDSLDSSGSTKVRVNSKSSAKENDNVVSIINKKNDSSLFTNGHSMGKIDKILQNKENDKSFGYLNGTSVSNGYDKRPAKIFKLEVDLPNNHHPGIEDKQANVGIVLSDVDSNFDNSKDFDYECSKLNEANLFNNKNNGEQSTEDACKTFNHTTNFASYIPNKDLQHGDSDLGAELRAVDGGDALPNETVDNHIGGGSVYAGENNRYYQSGKINNDINSSPRLNRAVSQNATSTTTSDLNNSGGTRSYQRNTNSHDHDDSYEKIRGSSPVVNQGLNGLKNIGNTCFMNSVIQCLSNTKLLLEYVKNDAYVNEINTTISGMKGALIRAFSQVIKELWSEDASDRVVNTAGLKSQIQRFAPRFMGYSQQDAQEFLRYLLEGLHEDVNRVVTKPTPILTEIDEKLSDSQKSAESWQRYLRMDNSKVVDIFVGQLKSTLKCTHCGHCSVTFDPFWDLSLPIPQRNGQLRLQQCLDHFTREETLDGDEKPTCSKCKERRKCTKSFTIQKFPKILVIHLKRFSPTERFRGKLSVTIDFPLEGLDMRNYAAETPAECRYNLYAISNHSGTTYSGHYTAYCRHPYTHTWHEYNDSRVSSISPKSLVSGEAYVLFYELENQRSHL